MKNCIKLAFLLLASMPLFNFSCDECYEPNNEQLEFIFFSYSNNCFIPIDELDTSNSFGSIRYQVRYEIITTEDTTYFQELCPDYFVDFYEEVIPNGGVNSVTIEPETQDYRLTLNPNEDQSAFLWKRKDGLTDSLVVNYSRSDRYSRYCGYEIDFYNIEITKSTFNEYAIADDNSWIAIYVD